MTDPPSADITQLLDMAQAGDDHARARFVQAVYDELRHIARRQRHRASAGDTLNTTAVVHEAYEKLFGRTASFEDRRHFFGAASRAMRDVLVDYARARQAEKRGGGVRPERLSQVIEIADELALQSDEVISLDQALTEFEPIDPVSARIVELRYFCGLANAEVGEVLGMSERTVKRRWRAARAWLYRNLTEASD